MEQYRKLYSYLPYFEKRADENLKTITEGSSLFHASYVEKINEFVSSFYDSGFVDSDYGGTLSTHGITSVEKIRGSIPTASADLLKAIMTQMIREERFSSGAIASYAENGFIEQALRRLGGIYGYTS
ncbi:DUF6508 domain-containing protein [Sporosarcina aquimarina]|uniref:DUF6508 domain-containing protein n=1 Tax=Sporosarcina aquimarina TaxID=114975 RepID=A0ABU4FUQ4_9BACL|nr:DUF6508 domain-containing protein [Sporosarcina aquimarina]MDW0108432.1 DUF6508 domain-containing protein [Sporosarcina aquimarina]